MNARLSHTRADQAPIGVPLALLVVTSLISTAIVWASPSAGAAVAVLFTAYWCTQIIRSGRQRPGIERRHRAPRHTVAAEFLIIVSLQLPWIVWLLVGLEVRGILVGLVLSAPVLALLGYRGLGRAR